MSLNKLVYTDTAVLSVAPPKYGRFCVDFINKKLYCSFGTTSPSDWVQIFPIDLSPLDLLYKPKTLTVTSKSTDYTLVLEDANTGINHPVEDNFLRTFTIPANADVNFPVGTLITFINQSAANLTIAITSDTMYLAGTVTTGSRILAQNGSATALKVTTTIWQITGGGLS